MNLTKTLGTKPAVSFAVPADPDVRCPFCGSENIPLRGGGVKAYIMHVEDERGEHYECASCSKAFS